MGTSCFSLSFYQLNHAPAHYPRHGGITGFDILVQLKITLVFDLYLSSHNMEHCNTAITSKYFISLAYKLGILLENMYISSVNAFCEDIQFGSMPNVFPSLNLLPHFSCGSCIDYDEPAWSIGCLVCDLYCKAMCWFECLYLIVDTLINITTINCA